MMSSNGQQARNRSQKQTTNKSKKGHRKGDVDKIDNATNKITKKQFYDAIEEKIGSYKICDFGFSRGSKTGITHEGSCNVSIRDFALYGIHYDEITGEIIFEEGSDGLERYCRKCSKRCRNLKISNGRKQKNNNLFSSEFEE